MAVSKIIYFIDENDRDRNANWDALRRIFRDTDILVEAPAPFSDIRNYAELLGRPDTAAFLIDQNMRTSGLGYNGIDVASFLRGIDSRIPIYIITGGATAHADIGGEQFKVEAILSKDDLDDEQSDAAQIIKARILRGVDVHKAVLSEREGRFHTLLLKSLDEELDSDELREMGYLEGERLAAVQAIEMVSHRDLAELTRAVEKVLGEVRGSEEK